jgi:protein-S-isoprenylcysteine O-methyltransferase Ste14
MQGETIFKILLPLLVVAFVAHRSYYVRKHGKEKNTLQKREEGIPSKIASMLSISGILATIIYVINPNWLSWATIFFPSWLRWSGVGIALSGFALLQWAQNTLDTNWSDTPRMIKGQALITNGPYRTIRHPINTAFILILGSTFFISANWLIGFCWAGMTILETSSRIQFEESLMLEYFGEQYQVYKKKTGKLFPKFIYN